MKNISKIFAICASLMMVLATSCKVDKSVTITVDPDSKSVVIPSGYPLTIKYSVTSGTKSAEVKLSASSNISLTNIPTPDKMSGKAILTLISPSDDSYMEITASNGVNTTTHRVDLEMESVKPEGNPVVEVPANGGIATLNVLTNINLDVIIPESASSWLSYTPAAKTIESKGLDLEVKPNDDITRRAKVTVKSKTSELKADFTVVQKGILNNLFVTFGQREVIAPNLLGSNPSGTIYWGDDLQLKWQENAQHIYTDNKTQHIMELHTPQRDVEFTTLEGVVRISFIDL